jgi:hypothetical protein
VFVALLGIVFVLTVVRYVKKVEKPSDVGTYTRSAFLRWKPQIQALNRGENIYVPPSPYPNPPIMAVILQPFMQLPSPTDAVVWLMVKAGLAVLSFRWVLRLIAGQRQAFSDLAQAVVVVFALHPVLGDLSHGNVNLFIAFLVFGGLELFRRGWDLAAGFVLALATACKVTPALFIPYFGWKAALGGWTAWRERTSIGWAIWREGGAVLCGYGVGLILWLFVVPGLAFGETRNHELLGSWYDQMVRPFVVDGKVTSEHANQSIPGVVFRLLTHEPSVVVQDENGKPVPSEYRNVMDIGPDAARWVIRGFQAAFVVLVVFLCRSPMSVRRQGLGLAAEFALITLGMLLFSERTWKHHATTLVLPVAVLVGTWSFRPLSDRMRGLLFGTFAMLLLLLLVPSVLWGELQDICLVYGTHTVAMLVLAVAIGVVLAREGGRGSLTRQ